MTCAIFNLPESLFLRCYPDPDDGIRRCLIAPSEFLRLAAPLPNGTPITAFDPQQVSAWTDCPRLQIDPDTRQVLGHEGRHRLAALAEHFWRVEIVLEITPDPCRFDDLDAMLAWVWDGQLPVWDELQPEPVWRAAHV